jgi:hypothetical protein
MNERILKLAVEAGMYVDLNGTPWPRAMSAEESEATYKKFAHLIVQECAEVADKAEPYQTSDLILKHFGVDL